MAQAAQKEEANPTGLVAIMAKEQHLEPATFAETVRSVACPPNISKQQFTAFLMVCHEHKLNPITREIFGFESRGRVQPIVSIDGWLKIINERPEFDGMEFKDTTDDEGNLLAITCRIYRKDRKHPTEVTEYMHECKRGTEVWKNWPARMLRHKATIQAARYAFGFSGIFDQDEAERGVTVDMGAAEIVEEKPMTAATRLKSHIREKVQKEDLAPPEGAEEVSVDEIPGIKKGSELKKPKKKAEKMPDGEEIPAEQAEYIEDNANNAELSDEAREWLDDMEDDEK